MGKRDNRGSALAMVLIIFSVLAILGVTLLGLSVSETRLSKHEENKIQAFYIAKAGAEAVAQIIDKDEVTSHKLSAKNHDSFAGGDYLVKITHDADGIVTSLTSTGIKNGVSQTVVLGIDRRSFFSNAILANDEIYFGNKNCKVTGNGVGIEIVADQTATTGLQFKNGVTTDDVLTDIPDNLVNVGSHRALPGVDLDEVYVSKSFSNYPNPINAPESLTINSNVTIQSNSTYNKKKFDTITVGNGKKLTFQLNGGQELYIMANNLIIDGTGTISVTGTGSLFIYTDFIRINKFFDTVNTTTTYLFVKGAESISELSGSRAFFGYVYAPNANINIKANLTVTGAVVCKSMSLDSGAELTYNAGNAGDLYPEYFGLDKEDTFTGYKKRDWQVK